MIFLSKKGIDRTMNEFAAGCSAKPVNTDDFVYESSDDPIFLRGVTKYKIMQRCLADGRDFYYVDTGYIGNERSPNKSWHRIVKNNLQHSELETFPDDRFQRVGVSLIERKKNGKNIVVAVPTKKPCRYYGVDVEQWLKETVAQIKRHTDRPIVIRRKPKTRAERVLQDPLAKHLNDAWALVTYNSISAVESVFSGVPAFALAPVNAADPVVSKDLSQLDDPFWPDDDLRYQWACSLAYGQYHIDELRSGQALRMLKERYGN